MKSLPIKADFFIEKYHQINLVLVHFLPKVRLQNPLDFEYQL